ncbi:MAG: DUF2017 family protein, partial [Acidimicrobiales bacterium]
MIPGRRVKRARKGGFDLRLPEQERELVASLVGQLRTVLTGEEVVAEPSVRRLFPSAYADDAARDAEYRELVHDDLLAARLAALDVVEATVEATHLDEEELHGWMGAVNDLRLVLGTRLDVSEETLAEPDPHHPDAPALAVYQYLS